MNRLFLQKIPLKYIEIGLHILFWITYFTYPIIKFGDYHDFEFFFSESVRNILFISLFVYLTYYFFNKGIKRNHIILLIIVLIFLVWLNCHLNIQDCDCDLKVCLINKTVEYLLVSSFFIAMLTIKKNIITQRKLQKIEKENIKAELKSLRAQINPHFLFNTLNMLYANALTKDEALANKILKLSDSLHYLLHEGNKKRVSISQEIDFISGYIDLQKARLNDRVSVHFDTDIDDKNQLIPPLLLIPFVENAFKYAGMVDEKKIPIHININLKNAQLRFNIENKYDPKYAENQSKMWKKSGIGLLNVKKRLQLLFPSNKYQLVIDDHSKDNIFIVKLNIDLK